jgi:hypothetical protein
MNEQQQKLENYPIELKWEEPSGINFDSLGMYDQVLRKVMERPGQWGRLRVMTQGSAYATRKRMQTKLHALNPHWEVKVSRLISIDPALEGMRGLYVRYRTDDQMGVGDAVQGS